MIHGCDLTKIERSASMRRPSGGCWLGEGDLDGALATCATRRPPGGVFLPPLRSTRQADRGPPDRGDLDGPRPCSAGGRSASTPSRSKMSDNRCSSVQRAPTVFVVPALPRRRVPC